MKWIAPLLLFSLSCLAQDTAVGVHAPDGGTFEQINSILIPPVLHAPFSVTVTAEWTKIFEDGSSQTVHNHRLVVRDSAGRIYQERRRLVPADSTEESDVQRVEISDPAAHSKYFCHVATQVCTLEDYTGPSPASAEPVGLQRDKYGSLTVENLGKTVISGLDVVGTRETRILNPGAIGNDRSISIIKEIWYSPQLGINLSVKRSDPRHGTEIFNVTDISLAEPDAKYFELPAGFKVIDHRVKPHTASSGVASSSGEQN